MSKSISKAGSLFQQGKGLSKLLSLRKCPWLIAVAMAAWAGIGFAAEHAVAWADPATQDQVVQLLQTVIQDHWNGGEAKSLGVTNGAGSATNIEAAFRKASKLMPYRLDLRFGIASALMMQAIQTNGPQLKLKVRDALREYREIESLDTNGFAAPMLYVAYTRAIGDTNASDAALKELLALHPRGTSEYLQRLDSVDRILQITPQERPQNLMPKDNHHAIIVLGAGLETNGLAKAKLIGRLEQCLRVARMYRRAPIILTGGNQKAGVTEAYVMSLWCRQKGISRKRLILEDRARDTVENALFSSAILQRLGVTHVTLVTSSSHVRRGLADLEQACLQRGLHLEYATLAARKGETKNLDEEQERVGIYRDVMRLSGLWSFPGLQR